MSVEIRRVQPGDEPLFRRVAPEVFDHAIDPENLARYLLTSGHYLIVAIADGEIVGQVAAMAHLHPDGLRSELFIDEIAVTPALQRQGIARRMLDAMLEIGRELGCQEAWLGTEPDNLPAKRLYARRSRSVDPFVMYAFTL
jgi:aminoglycoside 6'-N-acetyltransferase I